MMKRLLLILSAVIVLQSAALAQFDKNGGSLYSMFGVGELNYSTSTRTDAMGVMGISLYGNYSNSLNPAAWMRIPQTLFTTKIDLARINSSDGQYTAKRSYGNFETFAVSIPLNKGNGWVLDLSMRNYSTVNYDTKFSGLIQDESYTQYYSGNGGLERFSAGFSYLIFRYFGFGLQFNYLFGNIVRTTEIDFVNPLLVGTKNTLTDELRGFYINTGLIFHGFGKLFKNKKLDNLTVGAVFSSPFNMNSTIHGYFSKSTQIDSLVVAEGKVNMPYSLGFGISNTFGNKLVAAADIYMQNWDNYKHYDVHPNEIKNNIRAGLGFEYTASRKRTDSFLMRTSYRLGGSYTMDNLEINGERVKSIAVYAGFGLPLSRFNGLDISFSYQKRGKNTNGLILDNLFKLSASVNIGELWFLKPSDDF